MYFSVSPDSSSVEFPAELCVFSPDFEAPFRCEGLPEKVTFTSNSPTVPELPILLVNVAPRQAEQLIARYVREHIPVFYQVDARHIANFQELLEHDCEVAVTHISTLESGVVVAFGKPGPAARPATDFACGLQVFAHLSGHADYTNHPETKYLPPGTALTPPTLAGLLIDKITPYAKRVKPYLPTRVVVGLYKVIARLR